MNSIHPLMPTLDLMVGELQTIPSSVSKNVESVNFGQVTLCVKILRNVSQEIMGEQSVSNQTKCGKKESLIDISWNANLTYKEIENAHEYEEIEYEENSLEKIRGFFNKCFARKTESKKSKVPLKNTSWNTNPIYKEIENAHEYEEIEYEKNSLEKIRGFFNKCFPRKTESKKLKVPLKNISWNMNPIYKEIENTYEEIENIYEEIGNIREFSEDSEYEVPRQVESAIYLEVLP